MGNCIIVLTPATHNNVQYVGLNVYAHLINKQVCAIHRSTQYYQYINIMMADIILGIIFSRSAERKKNPKEFLARNMCGQKLDSEKGKEIIQLNRIGTASHHIIFIRRAKRKAIIFCSLAI